MRRSWILSALVLTLFPSVVRAAVITTEDLVTVVEIGPGSWDFSVGGWDGGGVVTGSFGGTDSDLNGQLSFFDGEVTAFSASYSGGTIVEPLSFVFGDLFGLVYDLDGGPLGDGLTLDIEGIGAISGVTSFAIGPGPVGVCGIGEVCGIIDGPAVPEPPMLPLVVSGMTWAVAVVRRRLSRRARPE